MIRFIGLISPVIIPIIIAGILFLSSERNNKPRIYLAGYMVLISFVFGANFFYFEYNFEVYAWVHSLHIAAVLAIYPGAYVYVKLLTTPGSGWKTLGYHFIPSLFFFLASASIFFSFLTQDERLIFLADYRHHPDFSKTWMKVLYFIRMGNVAALFFQVFVYLFLTMKQLRIHRQTMEELFSNPEKFQLNWLNILNISLAMSAFICVFLYSVNPSKLFGDERFLAYPLLLIALILWFLGIMGNNQSSIPLEAVSIQAIQFHTQNYENELMKKIAQYFDNEKPYLDPDLKIWDVASALGSNRTYISQAINQESGKNFSSFVNSYRLKEARRMLDINPRMDLQQVASETGFGSVSSLSRAFYTQFNTSISSFRRHL